MKKLYNTPELNVAVLNQIDTMTASGLVDSGTDKLKLRENNNANYSYVDNWFGE